MKPIEIFDKNNVLVINWTLNSICTYHCTYCPDSLHRGTNTIIAKGQDRKILENFLLQLKDEVKDRPVHVFLNGVNLRSIRILHSFAINLANTVGIVMSTPMDHVVCLGG